MIEEGYTNIKYQKFHGQVIKSVDVFIEFLSHFFTLDVFLRKLQSYEQSILIEFITKTITL